VKYKNANEILPDELISELQKYICGEIIYVPKPKGSHKKWGEISGSKKYIRERNNNIRNLFKEHRDIEQLAYDYCLSIDSIKKIVYSKGLS